MSGLLSRLYRGDTNIDFLGKRRIWFALSAVLVIGSITLLGTRGLNFGIEFEGGVATQAPVDPNGSLGDASDSEIVTAIRDALGAIGQEDAQIQVATEGNLRTVLAQTEEAQNAEEQAQVVETVADTVGAEIAETDSQRIGSKWGEEITDKATRALIAFIIVILLFMSWRFEWKMALAAIAALVHDLLITAGLYSLVGFEVTPSTVIAILTILGYSLYDTVVVFDMVDEDTHLYAATGRMTYADAANGALNRVFMRSLNTSLSTLLPVAALLFVGAGLLGAGTLKDLALALFVGILLGSYSSIFVATPVLSIWKEREPKFKNVRERVLRDAKRAATKSPTDVTPDGDTGEVAVATVAATASSRPAGSARPAARPRAGTKKSKRRKKR